MIPARGLKQNLPKPNIGLAPINETDKLLQDKARESQIEQESEQSSLPRLEPHNFAKDRLYVTFSGIIQSGFVPEQEALALLFTVSAGPDWKLVHGQRSGISQMGSSYLGGNRKITWNLPFELTFETSVLVGWPQLILVLSGTDFFGRSIIKAYGNIHMPSSPGCSERSVQLFAPKPLSIITGLIGYLNGCVAEIKEPEKVLYTGEGREAMRVEAAGQVCVKIQTVRYNFNQFGYA